MHPRNKLRLMAGIVIDPLLEVATSPVKEQEQIVESHAGGSGSKIQDKTGKEWIIKGHDKGEGPEEKYMLECPKTGKQVEKKASELVTEVDAMGVSEVTPNPRASEQTSTIQDNFGDGDIMFYNNGVCVVVLADPKSDMIGIIPAGLIRASAAEKNRAVEMVKPDSEKCRKPTREEIEVFKMSDTELAAVDDDMDIQFSAEAWDMSKAAKGGEAYTKASGGAIPGKQRKKRKKLNLKRNRGAAIENGGALGESTHNYAPGNKKSHKDVQSDPINVVGQGEKQWANSLDSKEVKNEYTLQTQNRGKESMTEENEKVKVPNNLKSALKEAIKAFKDDAAKQGNTHTARENAQMMMDTAEAFQQILDHLNEGSVMDIKHAQIFTQTLMGPMLHKLPDGVWDFLTHGGQKRSLKDYMNKV